MSNKIIFFDMETGGLYNNHPDIQIAAIAVEEWEIIDDFEAKLKFDPTKCDAKALQINSYDPEIWGIQAVDPSTAVMAFREFLNRHTTVKKISRTNRPYYVCRMAGHNIARFDCPRLMRLFKNHNEFLPADTYKVLDTMQLLSWFCEVTKTELDSFKLTEVCEELQVDVDMTNAHDAYADCILAYRLAQHLMERISHGQG